MSYDFIALAISVLLILIYYFYLARRTRRLPNSSMHALNTKIRERWVSMIMGSGNMDILAIQTLRNSVMAANFMAATAILLIVGILNLSEKNRPMGARLAPFYLSLYRFQRVVANKADTIAAGFFYCLLLFCHGNSFFQSCRLYD